MLQASAASANRMHPQTADSMQKKASDFGLKFTVYGCIQMLAVFACLLLAPTPATAANVQFDCWCRDATTRICNHYQIDSGVATTDPAWALAGVALTGSVVGAVPGVVVAAGVEVNDLLATVEVAGREDEIRGLCHARCTADGGKTAIHFETTYREEICSECNANPQSSCTEDRGGRLAFGETDVALKVAACEERQAATNLFPVHLAIPIGGVGAVNGLSEYINVAYRYLVSIVLIVAIVMVVYGGFRYLVGASIGDIQAGKKIILDAIVGMLLVLGAYMILSTVNQATTILSLAPPEAIKCEELRIPEAIKNARCNSDTDCAAGTRCVQGRNYIFSTGNVARTQAQGAEGGAETGQAVARFVGEEGEMWSNMPGVLQPFGVVATLLPASWREATGEAAGWVAGAMGGNAVGTIRELRRDVENIKVCSTGEQGSPCLQTQACRQGLECIRSWSLCWSGSGNQPGQPCDTDAQCANRRCTFVGPTTASCNPLDGNCTEVADAASTPYKVCAIDVRDGTPCFRPNNGLSTSVFPIQCNGSPLQTEFVCMWCPSGAGESTRTWTYLNISQPFPAQCKPKAYLTTLTPCAQ